MKRTPKDDVDYRDRTDDFVLYRAEQGYPKAVAELCQRFIFMRQTARNEAMTVERIVCNTVNSPLPFEPGVLKSDEEKWQKWAEGFIQARDVIYRDIKDAHDHNGLWDDEHYVREGNRRVKEGMEKVRIKALTPHKPFCCPFYNTMECPQYKIENHNG